MISRHAILRRHIQTFRIVAPVYSARSLQRQLLTGVRSVGVELNSSTPPFVYPSQNQSTILPNQQHVIQPDKIPNTSPPPPANLDSKRAVGRTWQRRLRGIRLRVRVWPAVPRKSNSSTGSHIAVNKEDKSAFRKSNCGRLAPLIVKRQRWLALSKHRRIFLRTFPLLEYPKPSEKKKAAYLLLYHQISRWSGRLSQIIRTRKKLGNGSASARIRVETYRKMWVRVIFWGSQHQPYRTLRLLDAAVMSDVFRPSMMLVQHTLRYLVFSLIKMGSTPHPLLIEMIHRMTCNLPEGTVSYTEGPQKIHPSIISRILKYCKGSQWVDLYESLRFQGVHISVINLEHFLQYGFENHCNRPDVLMDVLQQFVSAGLSTDGRRIQRTCVNLLRARFHETDWYQISLNMFAQMLQIGIRPKSDVLIAIMNTAIDAEDYDTAYGIFNSIKSRQTRRSVALYRAVFNGVSRSLNHDILEELILRAEADGALPRNESLVFNLLQTVWKLKTWEGRLRSKKKRVYSAMLHVYARYCEISPLQDLGIYIPEDAKRMEPLSRPTPRILSLMMQAFMAQYSDTDQILPLYLRYHYLVSQNHPLIAPVAETDHAANAFVLHLGRKPRTLLACPMVIRNMLEPPARINNTVAHPTIQTWSILAFSYSRHGQNAAADGVLKMMKDRGLMPDHSTWNSIINGFAGCQDIDAVTKSLRLMDVSGFEVDSWTLRGLARITNQKKLLDSLKKMTGRARYEINNGPKEEAGGISSSRINEGDHDFIQYKLMGQK